MEAVEDLTCAGVAGCYFYSSIGMDSANNLHIAYVAVPDTSTLVGSGEPKETSSYPYLTSENIGDGEDFPLKYATNSSGSWETHFTGVDLNSCSIAIDFSNHVHVVGIADSGDLAHVYNELGSWQSETLDSSGNVGGHCIAVDSGDNLHVAYNISSVETGYKSNLKYINNMSGAWRFETIDESGSVGLYPAMALDSEDRIHIAYFDDSEKDLKYALGIPRPAKAIIVAGGASSDAVGVGIQYCAGLSFRNLIRQGFSSDHICFLTDGPISGYEGLDASEIRDGSPTIQSFQFALTDWARDAGELLLFMLGHGGEGAFRINEDEVLYAEHLDRWLDELQGVIPGDMVIVYDACNSGSFLKKLTCPSGKTRILIASAAEDQKAIFADQGAISFSGLFWAGVAGGDSFLEAFSRAEDGVLLVAEHHQIPQLDANSNGIANEKEDRRVAQNIQIGNRVAWLDEIPSIGACSPNQTVSPGDSVLIFADNVIDEDGIAGVTAVVASPDAWSGPADTPLADLPRIELVFKGGARYEAVYDGFTVSGEYTVSLMAEDRQGLRSMPRVFKVSVVVETENGSQVLYFPFAPSDGFWETEIGLVNTSSTSSLDGVFTAYDENGLAVGSPLDVNLNPCGRKQLISGQDFCTPERIKYVAFQTESVHAVGYQRPFHGGEYRAAVPASLPAESDVVYIPHVASDQFWWTLIGLVNAGSTDKELAIWFDNGSAKNIRLGPGECRHLYVRDLFDGQSRDDIHTAEIENAQGVVGLELFGNDSQLAGVRLDDQLAQTVYFPHIASDAHWETGLVAYNPGTGSCRLVIAPYTAQGGPLASETVYIAPKGRYFGTVSALELPENAAWIEIKAQSPITGFELFTTRNGLQIGGYTGVGLAKTDGVLPLLEKNGATGVAFVNVGQEPGGVVVTAYDDDGNMVDIKAVLLDSFEKCVAVIDQLFDKDLLDATHLGFSSDRDVVMFQLNGSTDGWMLDALPGL